MAALVGSGVSVVIVVGVVLLLLVVVVLVVSGSGGSDGVSMVGASSSWRPTGFSGRRRVPLFGMGSMPSESHMMLYTSIFSGTGQLSCFLLLK